MDLHPLWRVLLRTHRGHGKSLFRTLSKNPGTKGESSHADSAGLKVMYLCFGELLVFLGKIEVSVVYSQAVLSISARKNGVKLFEGSYIWKP